MFGSKKKTTETQTTRREIHSTHNRIGQGTKVEGEITCEGDIRIEGELFGYLTSKAKVVVGPTGYIKGDIVCENADISGKIEGTIRVKEVLYMKSTANIEGNMTMQTLVVDAGAVMNGKCNTEKNEDFSFELDPTMKNSFDSSPSGANSGY